MDKTAVDRWLVDYVEAWKTYDRDKITGLFAEDVSYRYHPYDPPVQGRDAVVASWLGEGDDPNASSRDPLDTYNGSYLAVAVDGEVAVATGTSTYRAAPGGPVEEIYHNCFLMRFDSAGRCSDFTEWFVQQPAG